MSDLDIKDVDFVGVMMDKLPVGVQGPVIILFVTYTDNSTAFVFVSITEIEDCERIMAPVEALLHDDTKWLAVDKKLTSSVVTRMAVSAITSGVDKNAIQRHG